jgi:hypothetical protein
MALTETTKVDQIEIVENGSIQVRTATTIKRDETEISKTFHRHVLAPGDSITNEDSKVQAIANVIWTEEIITAYQNSLSNGLG